MESERYYILPAEILPTLDIASINQTSIEDVRHSLDGTLILVSYSGNIAPVEGTYLTREQAAELIASEDWTQYPDEL